MGLYLDSDTLAGAVRRLSTSNAKPVLCDFLILKHAMTQGDGTVTLSPGNPTYRGAIDALTAVHSTDRADLPPFFNPFGTAREKKRGWRSKRYPSNGPPVTVAGANWQKVIEVLSRGPRRARLTNEYLDHLHEIVLTSKGEPPLVEDCAIWLYRANDVEAYVDTDSIPEELTGLFVSELGLTAWEQTTIFQRG